MYTAAKKFSPMHFFLLTQHKSLLCRIVHITVMGTKWTLNNRENTEIIKNGIPLSEEKSAMQNIQQY